METIEFLHEVTLSKEIVSIYVLVDPRDNEIRYVGQTADTIGRLRSALSQGRSKYRDLPSYKERWLFTLHDAGLKPKMFVVAQVPASVARITEYEWIDKLTQQGHKLTNIQKLADYGKLKQERLDSRLNNGEVTNTQENSRSA